MHKTENNCYLEVFSLNQRQTKIFEFVFPLFLYEGGLRSPPLPIGCRIHMPYGRVKMVHSTSMLVCFKNHMYHLNIIESSSKNLPNIYQTFTNHLPKIYQK